MIEMIEMIDERFNVFGWLSRIGLRSRRTVGRTGPLDRECRDLGCRSRPSVEQDSLST
jgi:hypothetical protein